MEPTVSIRIPVPIEEIDVEKVDKLTGKFAKTARKIEAGELEMGAAIMALLDAYYEMTGAIPMSDELMETIRSARVFEERS